LEEFVLRTEIRGMALALIGMIGAVVASNYLVQFPINDWLTWGAFTYPLTFLVTDLTNRFFGPHRARQVAYAGFAIAVLLSAWLADWRIAVASGTAFLVGQLLDIYMFDRLRRAAWWRAPFIGSALGSVVDTGIFFTIAFVGSGLPILSLMAGDLSVKLACALLFLAPFRALMNVVMPMPSLQNG
jgi:uncharacterized PurR-regulated membrane protein YhhQ (DUF165 family)